MKKIGIMGGTFNPIHIGHLMLGQWAMEAEGLDEIWFLPTGCSYMKADKEVLPPMVRYEMTCKAIQKHPRMYCKNIECMRQGDTYTYETLEELHQEYPEYHFFCIFGADCLFSIEKWKHPERIFAKCSVIAAVRGNATMDELEAQSRRLRNIYQADIRLLPFLQLEISSTLIRRRIKNHKSIRYLVPQEVISYIEEKGLYGYEGD